MANDREFAARGPLSRQASLILVLLLLLLLLAVVTSYHILTTGAFQICTSGWYFEYIGNYHGRTQSTSSI